MRYSEFQEARKNPEQNPKVPINQIITTAVNSTDDKVAGVTNRFVSFTAIDKLGINPKSKYDTPLGIYAYPGKYVVDRVGDDKEMTALPFAGNQPYVNLFKAKGNIINIVDISNEEVVALYKKLAELWAKESGEDWKKSVDQIETFINEAGSRAKFSDIPGGRLWYVTMQAARQLFNFQWDTRTPNAWNKLFRMLGVDGVVDTGEGIIHTSEPTQAVFFSTESITDVKRYDNKYSPIKQNQQRQLGDKRDRTAKEFGPEVNAIEDPRELVKHIERSNATKSLVNLIRNPKMRARVLYLQPSWISYVNNINPLDILAVFTSKTATSYRTDAIILAKPEVVIKALDLLDDDGVQAVFDIVADEYLEYKSTPALRMALIKRNPSYIESLPGVTKEMARYAVANWKPEYGDIPYKIKLMTGVKVPVEDNPEYIEIKNRIAFYQQDLAQTNELINQYTNQIAQKEAEIAADPSKQKGLGNMGFKKQMLMKIAELEEHAEGLQDEIEYYQQQLQSFK